jgi:hypothetical protein
VSTMWRSYGDAFAPVPWSMRMALSEVRHKSGRLPAPVACRCCPSGQSRSTRGRRYPSDMADAEWGICEPLLPAPAWLAGKGGRPA